MTKFAEALVEAIREARAELETEEDEGESDEMESEEIPEEEMPVVAAYERDMARVIEAAGWRVVQTIRKPYSMIQQVSVSGNGNITELKKALADYLGHTPFVWVESVINDYGKDGRDRFLLIARHDGCEEDPDRITYKMDELPNKDSGEERVDIQGIGDGIYKAGDRYMAKTGVGGEMHIVGIYDTPEEAAKARRMFINEMVRRNSSSKKRSRLEL